MSQQSLTVWDVTWVLYSTLYIVPLTLSSLAYLEYGFESELSKRAMNLLFIYSVIGLILALIQKSLT